MKRLLAILGLCVIILVTGCIDVNGDPWPQALGGEIDVGGEIDGVSEDRYVDGIVDGCVAGMFILSSPQHLPTYELAVAMCETVADMITSGIITELPSDLRPTLTPTPTPAPSCSGNCT